VFLAAGHAWASRGNPRGLFSYLAPVLAVALFAGFFDRGAAIEMGNIEIYKGLTGNPNYLGVLEAMALPLAIWLAYENWRRPAWRIVSLLVVAALLLALWFAGSRSAFLCVLAISVGAFWALTTNQRLLSIGLVGAAVVGVMVLVPTIQHSVSVRVINKGQAEGGVLFSRKLVWAESYDHAKQGGLFGVGYGATAGATDLSVKSRGLTSFGYGREKGNSQLAVWEETGLIGLGLYAILMVSIVGTVASAWRLARDSGSRLQLGLLLGTMVGLFIQSVFEAWWVAPGSVEFAYFFATLGVASGLVNRLREDAAMAARGQRGRRKPPSLAPSIWS
jgi:O-antigen ligase